MKLLTPAILILEVFLLVWIDIVLADPAMESQYHSQLNVIRRSSDGNSIASQVTASSRGHRADSSPEDARSGWKWRITTNEMSNNQHLLGSRLVWSGPGSTSPKSDALSSATNAHSFTQDGKIMSSPIAPSNKEATSPNPTQTTQSKRRRSPGVSQGSPQQKVDVKKLKIRANLPETIPIRSRRRAQSPPRSTIEMKDIIAIPEIPVTLITPERYGTPLRSKQ